MLKKDEIEAIKHLPYEDSAKDYERLSNMQDAGLSQEEIARQLNTKQRGDETNQ